MKDKNKDINERLKKELGIDNQLALPRLSKIVVNIGVKNALTDKKYLEAAGEVLKQITGQKPRVTKAKKAISTFKLREGDPIGLMVTLRGKRMRNFFNKLVSVVLPRLRDFHGISRTQFDGRGNYTLGLSEYVVFPEIDPGKVTFSQGLEVCIVTTARNDKEGMVFLEAMGIPFEKDRK